MKKGLIMEGGAMRGLFTAGVIDVLMENNIEFDGAVGVSAGAAFGCNYKSRQIGRVIRYNTKYSKDKRFCSMRSLIRTGDMYGNDFCYRQLPFELDIFDVETYESNPMEFFVVCTDVETGKPVYNNCVKADNDCMQWIRASASMPLVSQVVEVGGYKLLDGGISDSIPLKFFEKKGYEKNIVILTQPNGYVKGKNKLIGLMKLAFRKYPAVIETMKNRHTAYNETTDYIKQKEDKGEILVIRPKGDLGIKRTEKEPEELRKVYEKGRAVAEKMLPQIKEYLGI
ncbi:MAG: patatin family protein [Ruminiclostridium sp.]|nr:patatin family protein [Ruminiclostridium sp.]